MKAARTVSISIQRSPVEVYAYVADPTHLPEWSVFITRIRPDGTEWKATTTAGEVRMIFTPRNEFGILDHVVIVSPQVIVDVPMRVVKNEAGSEVLFTVFRQPGMTADQFEQDVAAVTVDLTKLKRVLEHR